MPDWIERLGGWGAVLLIVRWMMSRQDRLIDSLIGTKDCLAEFHGEWRAAKAADLELHAELVALMQKRAPGRNPEATQP